MRRRTFIAGLGSTAAWPVVARGQKLPVKLAVVSVEPEPKAIAAFEQGMRAAGWVKDANIRIDYYWGRTDPAPVVAQVVGSKPAVIATWGSPNSREAHKATSTIPIVFAVVSDPIGLGIVKSLAHPGGNVTGFSHFDAGMGGKWLELLHEITPKTTRVASMFNPAFSTYIYESSVEDAARTDLAAKRRIPALYPARRFVDDGGLISYGPDLYDEIHRSASYVDRILKGERPADLPVQAPTKFEFVINLKVAKTLGLELPPALLARADEVIE